MKRAILLVGILVGLGLSQSPALTPDFGVIVTSRGTYDEGVTALPVPISPVIRSALWLRLDGESERTGDQFRLSAIGTHTYQLDDPLYFDLERFQIRGTFPIGDRTLFDIEVGRFPHRDFSGIVLEHTLDGFRVGLRHPVVEAKLGMGTSYFVFPQSTTILMSKADLATLAGDQLIPGVPRVIAKLELLFPEVLLGQNIALLGIAQQDIHDPSSLIEAVDQEKDESLGGRLNTYYGGLGFSGTLLPALYWTSFGHFGSGFTLYHDESFYRFATILSYAAGGSLRLAIDRPLPFLFEVGGVFASGDDDHEAFLEGNTAGNSLAFVPISLHTSGMIFSPALTNVAIAEATLAVQPVRERVNLEFTGYGFFRPTAAPISEAGLDPDSNSLYLGTEVDGRLDIAFFSDLSLTLRGGVFIPWPAAFLNSDLRYEALAEITLSL